MKIDFNQVDHKTPDTPEIFVESTDNNDVWKDYCSNMQDFLHEGRIVPYSTFLKLRKKHFPHVKTSEYRPVTSQCKTCGVLSSRLYSAPDLRQRCSELQAYHQVCHAEERQLYCKKRALAVAEPAQYMSIIAGGMPRSHTQLPWRGDGSPFPHPLPHYVQGILEHGQSTRMVRFVRHATLSFTCLILLLSYRLSTERVTT
jgi:hypothetical protein